MPNSPQSMVVCDSSALISVHILMLSCIALRFEAYVLDIRGRPFLRMLLAVTFNNLLEILELIPPPIRWYCVGEGNLVAAL